MNYKNGPIEIWRTITGFENYEVSDRGRVNSFITNKTLKPFLRGRKRCQYLSVGLCGYGKINYKCVHNLVSLMFIGNKPKGLQTDHIDRNKLNNYAENFQYVTRSKNGRNRGSAINTSSKYKGVCLYKRDNIWQSQIRNRSIGGCEYLGRFKLEVDAAKAYNKRALELGYTEDEINKIKVK